MHGRSDLELRPSRERRPTPPSASLVERAARRAATRGMSRRRFTAIGLGTVVATALPRVAWPTVARAEKTRGVCKTAPKGTCPPGKVPGAWSPSSTTNIHSGIPSVFNGCGPEAGVKVPVIGKTDPVPDQPLGVVNFFEACKAHDCCYGSCGSTQAQCDQQMLRDAAYACFKKYGVDDPLTTSSRIQCLDLAKLYYKAIAGMGAEAWASAQATACFSCVDECEGADLLSDPQNCGACGNECSSGQVCCDGVCREVQTDHDHCGACRRKCRDDQQCIGGQCVGCQEPLLTCGGSCCDPETQECGGGGRCVRKCASDETPCDDTCCKRGEVCSDGRCVKVQRCDPGYSECGDWDCCKPGRQCVDGRCTRPCGGEAVNGPQCPQGQDCCWTRITDDSSIVCCPKGTIAYYYPLSMRGECKPV